MKEEKYYTILEVDYNMNRTQEPDDPLWPVWPFPFEPIEPEDEE